MTGSELKEAWIESGIIGPGPVDAVLKGSNSQLMHHLTDCYNFGDL